MRSGGDPKTLQIPNAPKAEPTIKLAQSHPVRGSLRSMQLQTGPLQPLRTCHTCDCHPQKDHPSHPLIFVVTVTSQDANQLIATAAPISSPALPS
jgi:hypothetical protein